MTDKEAFEQLVQESRNMRQFGTPSHPPHEGTPDSQDIAFDANNQAYRRVKDEGMSKKLNMPGWAATSSGQIFNESKREFLSTAEADAMDGHKEYEIATPRDEQLVGAPATTKVKVGPDGIVRKADGSIVTKKNGDGTVVPSTAVGGPPVEQKDTKVEDKPDETPVTVAASNAKKAGMPLAAKIIGGATVAAGATAAGLKLLQKYKAPSTKTTTPAQTPAPAAPAAPAKTTKSTKTAPTKTAPTKAAPTSTPTSTPAPTPKVTKPPLTTAVKTGLGNRFVTPKVGAVGAAAAIGTMVVADAASKLIKENAAIKATEADRARMYTGASPEAKARIEKATKILSGPGAVGDNPYSPGTEEYKRWQDLHGSKY